MRSLLAVGVLGWVMLMRLQPLAAQEPAASRQSPTEIRSPVLLVMESTGGVRAASALRGSLNAHPGVRVISLGDLSSAPTQPAAILTVAAATTRGVHVAYWDHFGRRDSLSAPAPARADQLDAVVLALASALLDRHRAELTGGVSLERTLLEPYAALGGFAKLIPRLQVALRFEDF